MEQPPDHSLKRFLTRVARSILYAAIIVLGIHFFDEPNRQHPWDNLGRAILIVLIFGLVLGTGRYFLDRRIAMEQHIEQENRKPNT